MFYSFKKSISKNGFSRRKISVSCTTQEYDNVTTPYYSIYLFIICRVVAYERLKTKENFKLIALISGRGRLQEVVAY